ncbi:hypothetical protein AMAG_15330 [Allomyces macrogynus ATCC 38327]|uniref:UDP-N-acetylglucosamine--dolichyl-phosphate N-acetylglucosaminephosphotransferase n=1 Tax=Allomyces macrogynus (strain ATCC 38327) TaxID=578462 RepID=A0A0L0T8K3_ALLM3|nr:hypothetical protein AMAG_15330 [Allomyces macrogynus ATCC 38327]|eukprot:KNE71077.1 hypothetical protein AMAG_15330 [Allomyces macrogynus ATCC 38327]
MTVTIFASAADAVASATRDWPVPPPLVACAILSVGAALAVNAMIPRVSATFIQCRLMGADLAKRNKPVLPESMGLVCGLVYLLTLVLLLPVVFMTWSTHSGSMTMHKFATFLSALLSIQSMLFLGFADDVLNIRWRHKIFLPALAALPMLLVYGIESGVTYVVVPLPLRAYLGRIVDLGLLYYLYMALVAIFCTNSINILAGINGVEAGQSLVLAVSLVINSTAILASSANPETREIHAQSLYLLLPFIGVTAALLKWNWCPARAFVGDTYTYFAGMVFAVCGILGHYSKTLLLFFAPQIVNFVLSVPQLFHVVPCPRHRLPTLHPSGTTLVYSRCRVPRAQLSCLGAFVLRVLAVCGLAKVETTNEWVTFSNLTLINAVLVVADQWFGRTSGLEEGTLAAIVLGIQVVGSLIAFVVRYALVHLFYP